MRERGREKERCERKREKWRGRREKESEEKGRKDGWMEGRGSSRKRACQLINTLQTDLWHHVCHELLAAKSRLDRHDQCHVDQVYQRLHLFHWRAGLDPHANLWREKKKKKRQ